MVIFIGLQLTDYIIKYQHAKNFLHGH